MRRLISPESAYNQLWDGLEEIFQELTDEGEPLSPEEIEELGFTKAEFELGKGFSELVVHWQRWCSLHPKQWNAFLREKGMLFSS